MPLFSMIDERSNGRTPRCNSSHPRIRSPAVMSATGSVLTNKLQRGYPASATTAANQIIDEVEELARTRAATLFGAEHANVQPHSAPTPTLVSIWRC